jgi:hypothetical protein
MGMSAGPSWLATQSLPKPAASPAGLPTRGLNGLRLRVSTSMAARRSLPLRTTQALPLATTMLFGRPGSFTDLVGTAALPCWLVVVPVVLVVCPPPPPSSPPPSRTSTAIAASAAIGTTARAHGHSRRPAGFDWATAVAA